ncbi:hypothetical protein FEM48_Zijuj08G0060400 [Ziziphus jujuba var. spinosa]|uniref:Elongation factor EFG domain-containing protein n=1 Tax=Ziziphus jujuba var. spinosa TaxID=714518 RepID=A0A978UXE2_ZIZJJ|nr:hypothetical protein FEM48_Zijuj08G0060400 [Ziziphus jujuba var. spinosa]
MCRGSLIGHPVENIRVVITDGASHAVDSSELAFKLAAIYAFRKCYEATRPVILEPVMLVELKVPIEFQGTVAGDINKRKGVIVGNDQDGDDSVITAHVSLLTILILCLDVGAIYMRNGCLGVDSMWLLNCYEHLKLMMLASQVPLNNMFGYSTALRSMTQGKGEFTMEYKEHLRVSHDVQMQLVNNYKGSKVAE